MRFQPKPHGRWKWLFIFGVPIVLLGVVGKMTNTNPPTNSAQTAPDAAPELRTRVYSQPMEEVFRAAQTVVSEQKTWFRGWRAVPKTEVWAGPPHREIQVEIPVLFFTDDLTVEIDGTKGSTTVNVASKSRVGQGDFGENRRHVAQFLRALDEALAKN